MTGMTDYLGRKILDEIVGKTNFALPTVYIGLFTTAPDDTGAGGTEVSGGSYARVDSTSTWNAAAGSAPCSTSNSGNITFPAATADWGTVVAFGGFDASTSGNLLWFDYLGAYSWLPFTGTLASPCVLTVPAHGYSNGDQVVVTAEYGGTLPTGTWTGLLTIANVTTNTFTAGVNASAAGNGMVRKVAPLVISNGTTASFAGGAPGALVLTGA